MSHKKISDVGKKKIGLAVKLIARATPSEGIWLAEVNPLFTVDTDIRSRNPRTEAETYEKYSRQIIAFAVDPAELSVPDIARIIRHEIRHWDHDLYGRIVLVLHRCSDPGCQNPAERSRDPIYAGDPSFLAVYRAAWKRAGGLEIESRLDEECRANQESTGTKIVKGLAIGAAAGLGITFLGWLFGGE